jgi:hypothetical protein
MTSLNKHLVTKPDATRPQQTSGQHLGPLHMGHLEMKSNTAPVLWDNDVVVTFEEWLKLRRLSDKDWFAVTRKRLDAARAEMIKRRDSGVSGIDETILKIECTDISTSHCKMACELRMAISQTTVRVHSVFEPMRPWERTLWLGE